MSGCRARGRVDSDEAFRGEGYRKQILGCPVRGHILATVAQWQGNRPRSPGR